MRPDGVGLPEEAVNQLNPFGIGGRADLLEVTPAATDTSRGEKTSTAFAFSAPCGRANRAMPTSEVVLVPRLQNDLETGYFIGLMTGSGTLLIGFTVRKNA